MSDVRLINSFIRVFFIYLGDYAFMGSLIIKEVVNELLTKGLANAKVLLLAGSRYASVCSSSRQFDRQKISA